MSNRRKFLQQSGMLAMAGMLYPGLSRANNLWGAKSGQPIGLQLYTLGNLMTTDTAGTLQKVAAIGYTQVESAGSQKGNWYGYKPKELAAMVKNAGMTWRSAHVGGAPITIEQI